MNLPKRVFLIDDDEEEHDIFMTALNECYKGIEIIYEKDCRSAIESLTNAKNDLPDIIFLDWRMPQVDGEEALAVLRTAPLLKDVPIIIFTGNADPYAIESATALGASYYLYKSFSINELKQKFERLFSLDWKHFQSQGMLL